MIEMSLADWGANLHPWMPGRTAYNRSNFLVKALSGTAKAEDRLKARTHAETGIAI